ncbi:MAG: hypothetical protein NTZ33_12245 [Bacteroidetes bacterium]|nr:hypothetical protein [Bacteroidota bacterium]
MKTPEIITIVIYALVGIISLIMACKCLFSNKFLPFHEIAAAIGWDKMDKPLQSVILALMRVSGLGFLVTALLLLLFPVVNYFVKDDFVKFSIPVLTFVFCSGLFLVNYNLYKQTKAATPWRGSVIAMFGIIIGMILSLLN